MSDLSDNEFQLTPREDVPVDPTTRRLEPLFSMLLESPHEALAHLLQGLYGPNDGELLNEIYPSTGLTHRQMREQIQLAMRDRGLV